MTDRRLLELAAKAAGVDLYATWGPFGHFEGYRCGSLDGDAWNPLTDDGDALRLAVKLRLEILIGDDSTAAVKRGKAFGREAHKGDHSAATRRAIVRAAAAMVTE